MTPLQRALVLAAAMFAGSAQALDFPLTQAQIREALTVYATVGQKSREFWNDPEQRRRLVERLRVVAASDEAQDTVVGMPAKVAQDVLMGQVRSALTASLPPPTRMGISLLQMVFQFVRPAAAPEPAQAQPARPDKVRIDYAKSDLPPSMEAMLRAVEGSSYDLVSLTQAMNYVYACRWAAGETPLLNKASANYLADPTPRGMMAFAVGLGQGRQAAWPAERIDALLDRCKADVSPFTADIDALLASMAQR